MDPSGSRSEEKGRIGCNSQIRSSRSHNTKKAARRLWRANRTRKLQAHQNYNTLHPDQHQRVVEVPPPASSLRNRLPSAARGRPGPPRPPGTPPGHKSLPATPRGLPAPPSTPGLTKSKGGVGPAEKKESHYYQGYPGGGGRGWSRPHPPRPG